MSATNPARTPSQLDDVCDHRAVVTAVRALLLDLDDTLIPDEEAIMASLVATATAVLPAIDPGRFAGEMRAAAREVWRSSPLWAPGQRLGLASWELLWASFEGGDASIAAIREWLPSFRQLAWSLALERAGQPVEVWPVLQEMLVQERRRRCRCYLGVLEMLERLRVDHRLAIVTNGPPDLQRTKIQLASLDSLIDAAVISGELGFGKPDRRIFETALAGLAVEAGEAVMVGDNPAKDVAGAQAVGIRSIWISHGRDGPEGLCPDSIVASIAELEAALCDLGDQVQAPDPSS